MYAYMCTYLHTYIYMYTYIYIYTSTYLSICVYVYISEARTLRHSVSRGQATHRAQEVEERRALNEEPTELPWRPEDQNTCVSANIYICIYMYV